MLQIIKRFFKDKPEVIDASILPVPEQIKFWKKANDKMKWRIQSDEFDRIETPPQLIEKDRCDGFSGVILSYGFDDDDHGNADAVLSSKMAWEYACQQKKRRIPFMTFGDYDTEHRVMQKKKR
jgi:hypothetical protein